MINLNLIIRIAFLSFVFTSLSYIVVPKSLAATETPQKLLFEELTPALSILDSANLNNLNNGPSATRRIKASLRKKLLKKTFRADEVITVSFNNPGGDNLEIQVLDKDNRPIETNLDTITNNGITTLSVNNTNEIKPGHYKLIVTGMDGKMLEQDFNWGVLAINTNKSYYKSGEQAHLEFAVLNEQGNMVCDAKLSLLISNQQLGVHDLLTTENNDIKINPECYIRDFTLMPDYEAKYTVREEGIYTMTLSAETVNGNYTIADTFIVDNSVPFDVERITATRIYPPNSYPVIFKITANQDFEGTITEAVPGSFFTSPLSVKVGTISRDNYINELSTQKELVEADETYTTPTKLDQAESENSGVIASSSADVPVATSSAYSVQNDPLLGELKTLIDQLQISLEMPFVGSYPVTQHFGVEETDPLLLTEYLKYGVAGHDGIDFGLPKGTLVLAADEGNVVFADNGDYGKTIILQHVWGRSYYGHLDDIQVGVGSVVGQGDKLGLSGNTGLSTGPHLHFGIKPNQNDNHNGYYGKVDPLLYINNDVTHAVAGTTTTSANTDGMMQITNIEYPVKLQKDETIQLEYRYLAPQKSPESYLLGPLQFVNAEKNIVFEESRQWQIASDATWVNSNWSFRKSLTLNAADVTGGDLSSFPVLITFASDTDLAANALDNGYDILFTDSNHVKIPAERESFDGGTGALRYWVNVPTLLDASNTTIYIYYGNSSSCDQTDSGCSSVDNTKNKNTTWTTSGANYVAVWHLEEVPSTQPTDSTGLGHTLSYQGGISSGQSVTAKIGKGIDLDGSNDYMTTPDAADLDPSSEISITYWLRFDKLPSSATAEDQYIVKHHHTAGGSNDYSYRTYVTTDDRINWNYFAGSDNYGNNWPTTVSTGTFQYHAYSKEGNIGSVYLQGVNETSTTINTATSLRDAADELRLGSDGTSSREFNGVMDEVRIASVGRTDGWIETEYNIQNDPAGFIVTKGAQECAVPPSTDKLMRHGKYFDLCGRHAFSW